MASDRDIDDAIDRAVRDIMGAEPRPGLRGRVLERIERPTGLVFSWPRLAAAGAVAAAAMLSFMLWRPAPPLPETDLATKTAPVVRPGIVEPRDAAPAPRPVPPPAGAAAPAQAPRRSTTPARQPQAPVAPPHFPAPGVVSAATIAGTTPDTAATGVAEAVPLPLDPNAAPIIIPAIHIEPLAIERIVIASISPTQ